MYGGDYELYQQIELQKRLDELREGVQTINNPNTGGTGTGSGISITGLEAGAEGFVAITTPSVNTRQIGKGASVGDLWDKDPGAAIANLTTLTAGDLPVSNPPTQAEVQAIRTALIENRDKINAFLGSVRTAGIIAT